MLAAACGRGPTEAQDPNALALIRLTPQTHTFTAFDQTLQVEAEAVAWGGHVLPDVTLQWSSTAAAIASVDGSGVVTAHANGTATITASAGGVVSGPLHVVVQTVTPPSSAGAGVR